MEAENPYLYSSHANGYLESDLSKIHQSIFEVMARFDADSADSLASVMSSCAWEYGRPFQCHLDKKKMWLRNYVITV